MAGRKYIIGVYITDGEDADTMATLDISGRPWHPPIEARALFLCRDNGLRRDPDIKKRVRNCIWDRNCMGPPDLHGVG